MSWQSSELTSQPPFTVMTASRAELEVSLFDDPGFEEKVMRLANDPTIMVAYVTQTRTLVDPSEEDEGETMPVLRLHDS